PFTAAELATLRRQYVTGTPQEREAVLTLVNSLPDDVRPALEGPPSVGPYTFSIGAAPSMTADGDLSERGADETAATMGAAGTAPTTEPAPDSKEYLAADADARRLERSRQIATDRMISQWASRAHPGDEVPPELAEHLNSIQ